MTFGVTRYRAPVDGLLPVLAAGGLLFLFDLIRKERAPAP
jgi:hypothetical protein